MTRCGVAADSVCEGSGGSIREGKMTRGEIKHVLAQAFPALTWHGSQSARVYGWAEDVLVTVERTRSGVVVSVNHGPTVEGTDPIEVVRRGVAIMRGRLHAQVVALDGVLGAAPQSG